MCNIGSALSRAMTPAGTGGLTAALQQAQDNATNAASSATDALTAAIKNATAAALPLLDNPSALAANQARQRKLMAMQGATWSFGATPAAAPSVATRVLYGG